MKNLPLDIPAMGSPVDEKGLRKMTTPQVAYGLPPAYATPTLTLVGHLDIGGNVVTAIYREWPPDVSRAELHGCSGSHSNEGKCLVLVPARIEKKAAPFFNASRFGQ